LNSSKDDVNESKESKDDVRRGSDRQPGAAGEEKMHMEDNIG